MSQHKIEKLSFDRYKDYERYVSACNDSMLYHTLNYKLFLEDVLGVEDHYLIALDSKDQIQGILPLMMKEWESKKVYNSLPFYGSNGGILSSLEESFNSLLNEYNLLVSQANVIGSTIITNPLCNNHNDYSKVKHSFTDYRIGQFTEIYFPDNHRDNLMDLFHYKTRNMVRKAMKQNIKVEIDNTQVDFLRGVHKLNLESIGGRSKPDTFFEKFVNYFKPGIDFNIYVAKSNDELIAALLLFYHKNTVEYYTPVIVEEFRDKQPLSLIIYEAMVDASKKGYKLWNWGGTWESQHGVYTFKKRWGTKDIKYTYYTQLNDQDILRTSKEALLSRYENFFVVPFQMLLEN
jgi:hypothetical protein